MPLLPLGPSCPLQTILLSDPVGFDSPLQIVNRKKKVREFPVPSREVTTKLSLGGNNDGITELFLPRGSLVSDIPSGDGKLVNLFLRCTVCTDPVGGWVGIPHHCVTTCVDSYLKNEP